MVPWKVEPSQARGTRGAQPGGGVGGGGQALCPLEAAGSPGLLCLSPSLSGKEVGARMVSCVVRWFLQKTADPETVEPE